MQETFFILFWSSAVVFFTAATPLLYHIFWSLSRGFSKLFSKFFLRFISLNRSQCSILYRFCLLWFSFAPASFTLFTILLSICGFSPCFEVFCFPLAWRLYYYITLSSLCQLLFSLFFEFVTSVHFSSLFILFLIKFTIISVCDNTLNRGFWDYIHYNAYNSICLLLLMAEYIPPFPYISHVYQCIQPGSPPYICIAP